MALSTDRQLPGGPDNVNEAFFDAMIRHQIGILRMSGAVRNRTYELLDATEAEMADKIKSRLAKSSTLETPADVVRMQSLVKALRATRLKAWNQVNEEWLKELRELSKGQPQFVDGALKTVVPVTLETTIPSAALLTSLVTKSTFTGKTYRQWFGNVARADMDRIESAVRMGMVQGDSSQAIARSVVGTRAAAGANGVTQLTRNNVAAIVRTLINGVANTANRSFYTENSDVFTEEVYTATLDSRTTPICRSLDGRRYPVGQGPIPPRHVNCRSLRVAVINGEVLGDRPFKASTERMLLREFADRKGISAPGKRAGLPRGTKGDFDTFSRKRVRELTGRVPAKVSYQEWLTRQSRAFQEDTLGATRSKLFRDGKLKLDKFVNRAGDEIPLSQLAKRQAQAFRDAGLDPEDFA